MTVVIVALLLGHSAEALRAKCSLPARPAASTDLVPPASSAQGTERRVFYGSAASVTASDQGDGTAIVAEMDTEVEIETSEGRPRAPQPARALGIPARLALEMLLGLRPSGNDVSSDVPAVQRDDEDDDSIEIDPPTPVQADANGSTGAADLR